MSFVHHWGSTPAERAAPWPGDRADDRDLDAWYRAVEVDASRDVVFRWLCQLRVAPYSYDWIDNLGRRSPRTLTPGAEVLAKGQRVMTIFVLEQFTPDEQLTIALLERSAFARIFGPLRVTYLVRAESPTRSRLLVKLRVARGRGLLRRALLGMLALGDLVMMRKQLLTLKRLAARDANRSPA